MGVQETRAGESTMSSKAQRGRGEAERRDHYADVTDRMIAALEAGTPPWRKPWDPDKTGGPAMPRNAVTGARYKGINTIVLGMSSARLRERRPALGHLQAGVLSAAGRSGKASAAPRVTSSSGWRCATTGPIPAKAERMLPGASRCCGRSRCSTSARWRAPRSSCRRPSPRRRGARQMRSKPSSPRAGRWCGSAASAPSTRR